VITLPALNAMTAAEFVSALSGVFEHSDWIAQRAAAFRPFDAVPRLLEHCRAWSRAPLRPNSSH